MEVEVRGLAAELTGRVLAGDRLVEAMRDVCIRHADHLRVLGPVGALALDPCPRCGGVVLASGDVARCACGWRYRETGVEPLGSRRADP